MTLSKTAWVIAAGLACCTSAQANVLSNQQTNSAWYQQAQAVIAKKQQQKMTNQAKNVILFVGDGMGISTLTAARILAGQQKGASGEEGYLSFEKFPYSAQVKTYNVDAQTPDSAGTMTAMMSGIKTDAGVLGVDEDVVRGDCSSVAGNELITALELAEIKGLSTGVVSTARITHATPAATYAKSADRNWEDISDIKDESAAQNCEDIASQLVNFEKNLEARYPGIDIDGIEVAMGGGRRHFLPKDASYNSADAKSEAPEGDRTDGRDLTAEWQQTYPQGQYVFDQAGFDAISLNGGPVLGLFNESHMHYEADRANDVAGEPSLTQMTQKSIELLSQNNKGYFLTVESGRIDHGHHAGNAFNALNDTIEFANAVQAAVDATNPEDTLILVTADHSHVFTIAGYPKRGNPILGKVVSVGSTEPTLAKDGLPYTTLGYANGLGMRNYVEQTDADATYSEAANPGRHDLTSVDTATPGFHQEAIIPLGSETHAGEDISLHAQGPGAQYAQGVIEQSVVFHLINKSLGLIK